MVIRTTLAALASVWACGALAQPIPAPLPVRLTTTVAALPACATATRGTMYVVTDALLPAALATVANGGAVVVGVLCNGTNWIVQ